MDRRKFMRGAGLIGLFAGGAVGAKIVVEEQKKKMEDISHLAPIGDSNVIINANAKPVENPTTPFSLVSNKSYQNTIVLSVGKDNRLWIKVDNEWKRVALDV